MTSLMTDLRMAIDPVYFGGQFFDLDDWQEKVLQTAGKRVLLNCCRQSGKSTVAAMKALHKAIYKPGSLTLLVSPTLRQSGELFRKVGELSTDLLTAPAKIENNRLSLQYENGSRIVSLPGTEETVRGYSGADLIIEDEASRVKDDLYMAIRPMLAVSGGELWLMSTPWGKQGHFYREWESGDGWERIRITADQVPRISPEFLEEERRQLGEWWFSQEYFCEFRDTVDQVFTSDVIDAAFEDGVEELFEEEHLDALFRGP